MLQLWTESIQNPWLLALLIIIGTYLLEDAAIISAALLSADGVIATELAFLALFIGIFTGDLGLYGLGRMLGKWQWLTNWVDTRSLKKKIQRAGQWLEQKMIITVLSVRLVPGLRLPTYLASGYFKLPFILFCLLTGTASFFWTGLIFFGFYWFGGMFWSELSVWKWLLLPIIILIMMGAQKAFANRKIKTLDYIWAKKPSVQKKTL